MEIVTEIRKTPNDRSLIDAAKNQPEGWIYDIDWNYPEKQRVPPEAIRGSWRVDSNGVLTGEYAINPLYRPIQHCTRKLKPYMHVGARTNKNQWIVEVDEKSEHLFPNIPSEKKVGFWYVDNNGKITDLFRENSQYKPDC